MRTWILVVFLTILPMYQGAKEELLCPDKRTPLEGEPKCRSRGDCWATTESESSMCFGTRNQIGHCCPTMVRINDYFTTIQDLPYKTRRECDNGTTESHGMHVFCYSGRVHVFGKYDKYLMPVRETGRACRRNSDCAVENGAEKRVCVSLVSGSQCFENPYFPREDVNRTVKQIAYMLILNIAAINIALFGLSSEMNMNKESYDKYLNEEKEELEMKSWKYRVVSEKLQYRNSTFEFLDWWYSTSADSFYLRDSDDDGDESDIEYF